MLTLNRMMIYLQEAGRESVQEAASETWQAAGHSEPSDRIFNMGHWGSLLLFALLVFFLVRAVRRQARYQAADVLSADDLEQLRLEIVAAEKRTVGEILPVVVERSDAHPQALWLAGLTGMVLGTAALASDLPFESPFVVLLAQISMGAVGYGLAFFLPDFARLFVREARATEMAQEQASQEFYRYNLHRTEAQTGVLIFVSLFERRVIVMADEGINAKVVEDQWQATDRAILKHAAKGQLRTGLVAGIQSAAEVLEEHFPWTEGDRNEIPDRIIVRKE
jgi:putative membrane protein